MTKEDSRKFINILRGLAIFLVLWGHTIQYFSLEEFDFFENIVFKVIYSFHMPLFMLISGYLFYYSLQKRNLKEILVHKTQGLLQPIFFGTILYVLFTLVIPDILSFEVSSLFDLTMQAFSRIGIYWFLWSTLACVIAVSITYKVTDKIYLRCILFLIGLGIVVILPCGQFNIYMFPYFILGFWYAKLVEGKVKRILRKIKYISVILFPVMVFFYKKEYYIYVSGMHIFKLSDLSLIYIDIYRWAIGLVGSVFAITITKALFNLLNSRSKIGEKGILYKLGEKSLQIYIIQKIVLEYLLPKVYSYMISHFADNNNILTNYVGLYSYIITPLIALFVGVICLFIVKMLEKFKISKIIFGR